eukprot:CAMPEP_0168367322 /NCGR_PEP_ID=MMETSP0228-20121227/5681_1 /TAXON_ID=133427 /ORGANISM="Protoceratium reticulatum, Strain CCCM 535 (=CCMP 1889)" /LENGTH=63 /DNA_ID=CAMNT_0008380145 /DNA_START=37 /DNA_END=229 /DNA_ORIENTATION=-
MARVSQGSGQNMQLQQKPAERERALLAATKKGARSPRRHAQPDDRTKAQSAEQRLHVAASPLD